MKKLVFSLAVLFSVALVSCGGNKAAEADSDSVVATDTVVEVAVDSADSTVVAAEVVVDSVK